MIIPEGVPADEYNTTFIYEKNGSQERISTLITILPMIQHGNLLIRNRCL